MGLETSCLVQPGVSQTRNILKHVVQGLVPRVDIRQQVCRHAECRFGFRMLRSGQQLHDSWQCELPRAFFS